VRSRTHLIDAAQRAAAVHEAAMVAEGYALAEPAVGERVFVVLSNGWRDWGVVTKVYKNGARRVKHDGGHVGNRGHLDLWRRS
jgi:hypothetical protein